MNPFAPERRDKTSRHAPSGHQEWYRGYRPTYAKVHRKYMSEETLKYYSLPYEIDRVSKTSGQSSLQQLTHAM